MIPIIRFLSMVCRILLLRLVRSSRFCGGKHVGAGAFRPTPTLYPVDTCKVVGCIYSCPVNNARVMEKALNLVLAVRHAMLSLSTALVQQAGTAWLIARRKKLANPRFLSL
ncbi:hypothetical protein [uncultured Sphingomonas sp.]|uniref:hypothetical protein n=1 Tax=uncultured Sphingomonas sp. TaxID=158754 RepID=UPI0025D2C851|nr:hypothetical protein [uncultured Sphingomonas sp.]